MTLYVFQGERLSHAVGCAFAICLERKQRRDSECKVSVTFDSENASFTRMGSFRQATITERLQDPQVWNYPTILMAFTLDCSFFTFWNRSLSLLNLPHLLKRVQTIHLQLRGPMPLILCYKGKHLLGDSGTYRYNGTGERSLRRFFNGLSFSGLG